MQLTQDEELNPRNSFAVTSPSSSFTLQSSLFLSFSRIFLKNFRKIPADRIKHWHTLLSLSICLERWFMKDSGRLSAYLIDRRSRSISNSSWRSFENGIPRADSILGHHYRDGTFAGFNDNCRLWCDRSFAVIERLVLKHLASSRAWMEIYVIKSKIGHLYHILERTQIDVFKSYFSTKKYKKKYIWLII